MKDHKIVNMNHPIGSTVNFDIKNQKGGSMSEIILGRIQGTIRDYQCKMLSPKKAIKIIEDIIDPAEIIEYAGINKLKSILKNKKKED